MKPSLLKEEMPMEQYEKLPASEKKLLSELIALEEKYDDQTVVCDLYKLGRMDGKNFSKEAKVIVRTNIPVEIDEFMKVNWHWRSCGKMYVIKESETENWHERLQQNKADRKENEELEREAGNALKEVLKSSAKSSTTRTPAQKKKEIVQDDPKDLIVEFKNKLAGLKLSKASIQGILLENNIPEEEYIELNAKDLLQFAAEKLHEFPESLNEYSK